MEKASLSVSSFVNGLLGGSPQAQVEPGQGLSLQPSTSVFPRARVHLLVIGR